LSGLLSFCLSSPNPNDRLAFFFKLAVKLERGDCDEKLALAARS
jgi:hypothetical protein